MGLFNIFRRNSDHLNGKRKGENKKRKMSLLAKTGLSILAILVIYVFGVFIVIQNRIVKVSTVERTPATVGSYLIVDTGQLSFWNSTGPQQLTSAQGRSPEQVQPISALAEGWARCSVETMTKNLFLKPTK
jgi:hypothetical protein